MEIVQGWQRVADRNAEKCEERDLSSPASLAGDWLAGDGRALECLLSEYEGSLLALCRRMLRHTEDAEDAVQETFVRAIRSIHKFQGRSQLKSWLYRIAVNICLDQLDRRRPAAPLDDSLMAFSGRSVEAEVIGSVRLEQALDELAGRRRAIFLLKEAEGWTAEEIAESLRCRRSLVYYELREAYRILARSLRRDGCEGV